MAIADADYQFFSKVVILTDSSNYAEWERLIQTTLILKDLEIMNPVTLIGEATSEDKANYKEVQLLLSAESICVNTAKSLGLWAKQKDQYSASIGSHQAQLL
ncbi:hypothetical protein I306_06897 [Cryptococcus gattii EJB2]|uniref:Retrotransposon Copia-like N-terminal domain-containing protein n=1 Tax=Cryptococcus gattii EJB2 TaxID=1296103 RepID=A0ABR5BKF9_9TREE|nr:hypothetical protein I306_06897 [Cryptococcus gattii EJB2]